jgi:hypothetical protein
MRRRTDVSSLDDLGHGLGRLAPLPWSAGPSSPAGRT